MLTLSLTLTFLAQAPRDPPPVAAPSAEVTRPPPRAALGRVSVVFDTSVLHGVDVEVHALKYVSIEGELGWVARDELWFGRGLPFALRAGPSGLFIDLRGLNGEGLSVRGSLLGGVVVNAVDDFAPRFTLQSRIETCLWLTHHVGVSLALTGGLQSVRRYPLLPELGLGAGLSF